MPRYFIAYETWEETEGVDRISGNACWTMSSLTEEEINRVKSEIRRSIFEQLLAEKHPRPVYRAPTILFIIKLDGPKL